MTDSIYSEELSTPDKLTDKIFHEFDRDQDGVLSFDEFCATASRDLFLVNLLECDPDAHKADPDVLGIDSTTAEQHHTLKTDQDGLGTDSTTGE